MQDGIHVLKIGVIGAATMVAGALVVGGVYVLSQPPQTEVNHTTQRVALSSDGLPAQAVLDAVLVACNGEKVRPVCDQVQALAPDVVHTTLSVELTLYEGSDSAAVLEYGVAAAAAYVESVRRRLGVDIVRSQIADAMHVSGVYKVTVQQPAADVVLQDHQWPVFDSVTVTIAGVARG